MIALTDSPTHPLDSIASKFAPSGKPVRKASGSNTDAASAGPLETAPDEAPALSPRNIQSPALLLDHDLRIRWQNRAAAYQLWRLSGAPDPDAYSTVVFDLLLSGHFQEYVDNWRQWVAFFLQQALTLTTREALQTLILQQAESHADLLQAMLTDLRGAAVQASFSGRLRLIHAGIMETCFGVIAMNFDQGRLLVFEPYGDDSAETGLAASAEIEQRIEMVRQHAQPVKLPFYIIAAQLNNADTLRTEMLTDEYSRLLTRLWKIAKETIEQFSGIFSQYQADGLLGLFLPDEASRLSPLQVVQCAFELKTRMSELGREWKIRKGWLHDLELNMGVHSGHEYLTALKSSLGDHLMPLGSALNVTAGLSALAQAGQIWTTKDLINQLSPQELNGLRFGIFRSDHHRQVFIARCFSRIRDLAGISDSPLPLGGETSELAVTQLFDHQ